MMALLQQAYPDEIDVGFCFLLCVPAQVATGEIPPWDE
jgi:hypothetical protein